MSGPLGIGGIGGSGTRVGARFLQILGFSIGGDLNEALDNLWFTLLFKHRSVLTLPAAETGLLIDTFAARMSGRECSGGHWHELAQRYAAIERLQHNRSWLEERARTFVDAPLSETSKWGWKEPNTHIILEPLLTSIPSLRYIHFFRNPLDAAFGANQNQLLNWGPIFLNGDVEVGPRDSLSYWCAVDRRMRRLVELYPGRILLFSLDGLCQEPEHGIAEFCRFVGANSVDMAALTAEVSKERANRSRAALDESLFRAEDLNYIESLAS
ncbi:MAG TPA: sulfotransferase [Sphingomicrobium sp.]